VTTSRNDEPKKLQHSFMIVQKRKKFPELPITKIEGDKHKQHEDDIAQAKRRLEEARNRVC
jgi:hypothetical protein